MIDFSSGEVDGYIEGGGGRRCGAPSGQEREESGEIRRETGRERGTAGQGYMEEKEDYRSFQQDLKGKEACNAME